MKLHRFAAFAFLLACALPLSSCGNATFSGSVATPYGTLTSDGKGNYVVELKPITVAK